MVKVFNKIISRLRDLCFPCEKTLSALVNDLLVSIEDNTKAVCNLNAVCHDRNLMQRFSKKSGAGK
jgi:hypothetical protein